MSIDWNVLKEFIKTPQRFVISTHMRPDGDALGSALGLAYALRLKGKQSQVVIASPLPPRYLEMVPKTDVLEYNSQNETAIGPVDAIIIVDTGTWNQLGKFGDWMRRQSVPKLVIDHHRTQDDLNGSRLVDIEAEACGRLIHQAVQALEVPCTKEIASNLFLALSTDTGCDIAMMEPAGISGQRGEDIRCRTRQCPLGRRARRENQHSLRTRHQTTPGPGS